MAHVQPRVVGGDDDPGPYEAEQREPDGSVRAGVRVEVTATVDGLGAQGRARVVQSGTVGGADRHERPEHRVRARDLPLMRADRHHHVPLAQHRFAVRANGHVPSGLYGRDGRAYPRAGEGSDRTVMGDEIRGREHDGALGRTDRGADDREITGDVLALDGAVPGGPQRIGPARSRDDGDVDGVERTELRGETVDERRITNAQQRGRRAVGRGLRREQQHAGHRESPDRIDILLDGGGEAGRVQVEVFEDRVPARSGRRRERHNVDELLVGESDLGRCARESRAGRTWPPCARTTGVNDESSRHRRNIANNAPSPAPMPWLAASGCSVGQRVRDLVAGAAARPARPGHGHGDAAEDQRLARAWPGSRCR